MKVWKRDWKFELIEKFNPDWLAMHERIEYRSEQAGFLPRLRFALA